MWHNYHKTKTLYFTGTAEGFLPYGTNAQDSEITGDDVSIALPRFNLESIKVFGVVYEYPVIYVSWTLHYTGVKAEIGKELVHYYAIISTIRQTPL